MVENKILRENARKQLGGNIFSKNWLLLLAMWFISGALMASLSSTGVGSILISGFLYYGLARITVLLVRGKPEADFSDLLCGVKEKWDQVLLLGLLTNIFTALWSLLLFIPGIVKSYAYALAPFIQQDAEDKDWKKCLDKSISMMQGYKWQLFCLDLSFIGWYLLGALCLGIGVIFVTPYHQQARANFYEALRAKLGE